MAAPKNREEGAPRFIILYINENVFAWVTGLTLVFVMFVMICIFFSRVAEQQEVSSVSG